MKDPWDDGLYAWNPNDPCFDWKKPRFGGLTFKNKGYLGSSCIYIYIYLFDIICVSYLHLRICMYIYR